MREVVRATTADLSALQALAIDSYRAHFAAIWTPAGLDGWLEREFNRQALADGLAANDQRWLLLRAHGAAPIGYARVLRQRPDPIEGVVGIELQKIYLAAGQTGDGGGRQLLDAVLALAREERAVRLWLQVLADNAAAQRFYARAGFQALGERAFATDLREIGLRVLARTP